MLKSPTSVTQANMQADGHEAAASGVAAPEQTRRPSVSEAVRNLNDYVQQLNRTLQFSVDEASGRTIIRVMDAETREVIRQIPPEEVVALARQLETGAGGLVEERA